MTKPCNPYWIISDDGLGIKDAKSQMIMAQKFFHSFLKRSSHALALGVCALIGFGWLTACQESTSGLNREQYRQAATALFQQQLYGDAIAMYDAYLKSQAITSDDAPKVLYQMAVIAQDQMRDCQQALAKLTVLKALYPDANFNGQVGQRLVQCLETVGRSADASHTLSRLTSLNPTDTASLPSEGQVVAEWNGRAITLGEVAQAFGKLPDDARGRYDATRSYVAQLVVAAAARRKGLNQDSKVKEKLGQIEDQILASEMLRSEVQLPSPSENDLKYFFEGNKPRYAVGADSGKSFQDLKARVATDWQREKMGEQTNAYVENLLRSAQVTFHTPQGANGIP